MKSIDEQDHYQVLEVSRRATQAEIDRAYRIVSDTYGGRSLALYSVYGEDDAAVIRARIEEAYAVLRDPDQRVRYDATRVPEAEEPGDAAVVSQIGVGLEARMAGVGATFSDLDADMEEGDGRFDGAKLRRARLRRGVELSQIADITKVSPAHLRNIEEENFDDLPATVYVRGFVVAYAQTLGLDPDRVAASYIATVEGVRGRQGRAGFLGRR